MRIPALLLSAAAVCGLAAPAAADRRDAGGAPAAALMFALAWPDADANGFVDAGPPGMGLETSAGYDEARWRSLAEDRATASAATGPSSAEPKADGAPGGPAVDAATVPEPATWALMGVGLAMLVGFGFKGGPRSRSLD